ncbi:ATP-binding cassette domain-containing protein [bacterium]|nr:ATP-binding cassette domain-containing protein [bacterium]
MIEVKDVSKSYGTTLAVDNVSFKVGRGEIVGFLGPNGAGKSTTMKVLTCYIAPTSGTATIDGFDILEDPRGARSRIGYLPENTPLYDEMGVLDYLGFMADLQGVPAAKRRARIDELIGICGIEAMAHKDIGELSKGFRQRVGLAQALLGDPPVLILDEPTSGLDPGQIVEIRALIKEIAKEKAILLSTHILPEAQNTCNRILIINEGRLVGEGTSEELLEMASGEERFTLTLKGSADPAGINAGLAKLPEVSNVDQLRANGEMRFKVSASRGSDLREALFDYAIGHNLKLLELNHDTTSLEDVFLKLTGSHSSGLIMEDTAGGERDE